MISHYVLTGNVIFEQTTSLPHGHTLNLDLLNLLYLERLADFEITDQTAGPTTPLIAYDCEILAMLPLMNLYLWMVTVLGRI